MSRVARQPIKVPKGVEVMITGEDVAVKGVKGALTHRLPRQVTVTLSGDTLQVSMADASGQVRALAGTTRALLNNMVTGVSAGFERKLEINGVGYRAQVQGKLLSLTLGYSHPISFAVPEGITIETPTQTEIIVKGASKQQVGEVAAKIRAWRPPEPYKGKGIKYAEEVIARKEAKKT